MAAARTNKRIIEKGRCETTLQGFYQRPVGRNKGDALGIA